MRNFTIAVLAAIASLAHATPNLSPFDLDRPGVMEAVARENPRLHLKISQIRALASQMPCVGDEFKKTLAVKFEASDASCGLLVMTSFPSKRRLQFTLDEMRYVTVVEMDDSVSRLMPAK